MIIWGAGLAGLLAANMFRKWSPVVYEKQDSLPNNHNALLRFRTNQVGTACAIPFKKVKVTKAIKYDKQIITEPNLFFSNMYSQKVTDSVLSRSIDNLDPVQRYIAPQNLIEQMSIGIDIDYNVEANTESLFYRKEKSYPVISTLPMPMVMKMIGWENFPNFRTNTIWSQSCEIGEPEVNINQPIYYPDPLVPQYRISIVGNIVIAEYRSQPPNTGQFIHEALYDDFGFRVKRLINLSTKEQKYGKIMPIDDKIRKDFIYTLTEKYNIFSVGRFATWRQLLLDDVVNDISVIERLIASNSNYNFRKEMI